MPGVRNVRDLKRAAGTVLPRLAIVGLVFIVACRPSASTEPPAQQVESGTAAARQVVPNGTPVPLAQATTTATPPEKTTLENLTELGPKLFATHCAACHGTNGDGKGIAADFLFPKPRDLRAGKFRLVSSSNNVPTRDDLHAVLLRGMPGSSMPPWSHLSQIERDALVDEIMRIRREGARESYIRSLIDVEELTEEEIASDEVQQEISDVVEELTTPGETTPVPEIGRATDESIARGKLLYSKFACVQCHGETGKGDGAAPMVDDEGFPTRPRDFTLGIFKGNPDAESICRRIAYGMPGTPMPSVTDLSSDQLVDLAHYIRSMSSEEQRKAALLNREKIVVRSVNALPQSIDDPIWSDVKPVRVRMTPLWWRADADPDLTVQAVHDGSTISFRLSWTDSTKNNRAQRTESFEDAVALQLYRGESEPFLGMGQAGLPVDVWFWSAGRQAGPVDLVESYPNAVVDLYPFSEAVATSAELDRPGARMADQPDISMPARASDNPIVPRSKGHGGSSLAVAGPGSVTFRLPQSKWVRAHGTHHAGRWTVVMSRALAVPSTDDGVSLAPASNASVAFAVWDGDQRDRDGQKSITIWQDLELQP